MFFYPFHKPPEFYKNSASKTKFRCATRLSCKREMNTLVMKNAQMTEAIKRNKIKKRIKLKHRNVFLAMLVSEPHCQE